MSFITPDDACFECGRSDALDIEMVAEAIAKAFLEGGSPFAPPGQAFFLNVRTMEPLWSESVAKARSALGVDEGYQ